MNVRALDFDELDSPFAGDFRNHDEIWSVTHVEPPERHSLKLPTKDFTLPFHGFKDHRKLTLGLVHLAPPWLYIDRYSVRSVNLR